MNRDELLQLRYQEALTQLRLHPQLIWTRNNFFLLVHTALLAVVASIGQRVLIAAAGIFLAVVWVWVNVAGQALQRRWRGLVIEFEAELFGAGGETGVVGPFTHAASRTREGATWSVSITSALVVLASGFVLIWGYLLDAAL